MSSYDVGMLSNWTKWTDLHEVLQFIKKKFPVANLYLCGVSMGANFASKYVGELGDKALVQGLVSISSPHD
jgi:predicted alpha/beta-fold hydrolase